MTQRSQPSERDAEGSQPPDRDLEIAAHFAPIIHQGLNGSPRFDYITNFDFDGDWRGDNNWENADNKSYPLRAYVYYSVIETDTHYYVHYAVFHPRDYKGGLFQSWLLAEAMRRAQEQLKGNLPPEAEDLALSHENDMEGCLVVAEKRGESLDDAIVVYVETMAHNNFNQYRAPNEPTSIGYVVPVEGSHPVLFCEPQGHGLFAYTGRPNQLKDATRGVLIYHYTGRPEDPEPAKDKKVGYRLVPLYGTLWQRARTGANETYGESADCGTLTVKGPENGKIVEKQVALGAIGAAFLGTVGAANKARPPWAWFDYRERQRPRGEWFFDPATTIKRHFYAHNLSTIYVHNPYLDIWRPAKQ
ncbi:MAG: hypothetical protein HY314_01825 [Acidobacteria bacterium]|nr:hypothetical protein [Acidobacteriota bacterium]